MSEFSLNQIVESAMNRAKESILSQMQHANSKWETAEDEDGNPNNPSDAREVLVFLCGDRPLTAERPYDAGWGLRYGYFDDGVWRVGGRKEQYVTHWMECPPGPETSQ